MRSVSTFTELKKILKDERDVLALRRVCRASNENIYECLGVDSEKIYILKRLTESSPELDFYDKKLPLIKGAFAILQLPELLEIFFIAPNEIYILLPYYDGQDFDFHKPDEAMAEQMVFVVKDLMKIDVEDIIPQGSKFDYESYERKFWQSFQEAVSLNLIPLEDTNKYRNEAEKIVISGRDTQKMIISNGDFNPRNFIRLDGKLVMIDWEQIVAPLEHHLTYPWLINFFNPVYPKWQEKYATQFEREIPVKLQNIRYHLMKTALSRAVLQKGFYDKLKDESVLKRVKSHMRNFQLAIGGFPSLTDLS